ncbi:hypothetical protein EIP91_010443 [Steccherinum ochraceum]|uniref:Xylanolytic transcriptional activator regulatory domain-containing protein n=1 Tax=Steccherinum ochraceum TaxID=92696 RepID=A0A4R0RCR8_9APHY|nr:hypothetical protein EIP91_010443 [Steccherinum ochraceum]
MACCKFFRPELYHPVKKLAHEFSVRAFAESWKRVEVCQAFACLTYWKEPDDTRVWTFIGYACRMALELGLNRFVSEKRLPTETDRQWLERRNRERTYLVLFVHDRSLSTQTGRQWMLHHEDELVRRSPRWHEQGGSVAVQDRRPEDIILAGFVQLRLIGSETSSQIYAKKLEPRDEDSDANHTVLLQTCNKRMEEWMAHWETEMTKAGGERFHVAFLRCFWLYLRIFLNSFGVHRALSSPQPTHYKPDTEALIVCFRSGLEHLQGVVDDFATMSTLRYGQDTITVMTAYSSVFLLKLLRNPNTSPLLPADATADVHKAILRTSESYDASDSSNASAAHHARFLKGLIARDIHETNEQAKLREKRDIDVHMSNGHAHPAQAATRGPHMPPGTGYPGTVGVPADQYVQYQQPVLPPGPSLPHANPGYIYSSPTSASPSADPAHQNLPQPYPPDYHASSSLSPSGSSSMSSSTYGYTSPHEPTPVVPSQASTTFNAPINYTQSDAEYYRLMFHSIGMGQDMYSNQQYPRQQGWVDPSASRDSGGYSAPAYSGGGEYGYQHQRTYDGYSR